MRLLGVGDTVAPAARSDRSARIFTAEGFLEPSTLLSLGQRLQHGDRSPRRNAFGDEIAIDQVGLFSASDRVATVEESFE